MGRLPLFLGPILNTYTLVFFSKCNFILSTTHHQSHAVTLGSNYDIVTIVTQRLIDLSWKSNPTQVQKPQRLTSSFFKNVRSFSKSLVHFQKTCKNKPKFLQNEPMFLQNEPKFLGKKWAFMASVAWVSIVMATYGKEKKKKRKSTTTIQTLLQNHENRNHKYSSPISNIQILSVIVW